MSEVKHTPGPWHINDDDSYQGCEFIPIETEFRGEHTRHICEVQPNREVGNVDLELDEEDRANASLIAAAPYLFAALEIILMTHDLSCKGEDCQISGIDLARAAIAKARGEQ